ncbi:MAG: hypothetical protein QHH12_03300 [Candidatus Bathyarchaeota archaeon]|jgi:hypothetical protein|nr:hypothetical protein [Candidatus Bathyarchaeota archaeon A05DMB-3]MDH7606783.1 hypothetical protein [Candidatus Bathyarchaeota archaeon]
MIANDKILKALESALNHLKLSTSALKSRDENTFSNNVWHIAAELEYALFLFSLAFGNKHDTLKVKLNPEPKNLQFGSLMVEVEDLLEEAKKLISSRNLLDAYKSAYMARHRVFKVQEILAKKKREMLKKK